MTTSTTPPPGPGLREDTSAHVGAPDPSSDRGVLVVAALALAVPVLSTIDVLRPVSALLGVLLLVAGPGYCVVVAAGFRQVSVRLAVTFAVSLGTVVLVATLLVYAGLWSTTAFAFTFGAVTLLVAASALPSRTRPRTVRRFALLAAGPVALGLLVGLLVPGAQQEPRPAATTGPKSGAAATPETTTSRLWSVGPQWWALVWDQASGSYTFQRRTTGGRWQYAGLTVEAARTDAIDVLWSGTRLVVVVAGSASQDQPAELRALAFVPSADGSGWVKDSKQPVQLVAGETTAPSLESDGSGHLWASYVADGRVWVTHTATGDLASWTAPVPVSSRPSARVNTGDSTALVQLGQGQLGLLWSDGSSRRLLWATGLAAAGQGAPQVSVLPVPDVNTGLVALEGVTADGAGHVYLVARGWRRASAGGAPRPVRELLSRDDRNHWKSSRVPVSDTVTGTSLATDTGTRTLYLFVANACCPRAATSYLTTSMDDPVLGGASAKGPPLSTGGTGLTRDLVQLTGGDPAAARLLRDDVLSPPPAAPATPSKASSSKPGQAATPNASSFRVRDVFVWLAVLAAVALMVILLRAETVAVRRSTVRTAGEPLEGRLQAPRWVGLTLVVVACVVLLPRLWGLLT